MVRQWVPEPSSRWLIAYFVLVFSWTTAVFSYVERSMISGVVCEWYFSRRPQSATTQSNAVQSLKRSVTYSFGSICLAAMLLTAVSTVQFILRRLKRLARFTDFVLLRFLVACFAYLESFVQGVNQYTLVYIAHSGDDFWTATKNCAYLFRRNLFSALLMGMF